MVLQKSAVKSSKSMRCSRAFRTKSIIWLWSFQVTSKMLQCEHPASKQRLCALTMPPKWFRHSTGPETHSPNWPSCGVWSSLTTTLPRMNSQAWVPTIPAGSSTGKALSDVQAQEFTLLTSTMGTLYLGHAGDLQRQQSKVNCREETSGWVTVSKKFSLKSWVLQDEKDSN